jgi:hypothetical protein
MKKYKKFFENKLKGFHYSDEYFKNFEDKYIIALGHNFSLNNESTKSFGKYLYICELNIKKVFNRDNDTFNSNISKNIIDYYNLNNLFIKYNSNSIDFNKILHNSSYNNIRNLLLDLNYNSIYSHRWGGTYIMLNSKDIKILKIIEN